MKSSCHVCFRKCLLSEGKRGVCGARECLNGKVVPVNYGRISSMALDPVEKKPFRHDRIFFQLEVPAVTSAVLFVRTVRYLGQKKR